MPDTKRIESLIADTGFAPSKSLGTLDTSATTWSVAAKLGRYVLSDDGIDMDAMAREAATWVAGANGLAMDGVCDGDDGLCKVERLVRERAHGVTRAYPCVDGEGRRALVLVVDGTMPATYLGRHEWGLRGGGRDGYETIACCRLATYVGAVTITGGDDPVMLSNVLAEGGRKPWWTRTLDGHVAHRWFMTQAEQLWGEESCREANRRYARSTGKHTATVFEDKKQCDDAHRNAASHGTLASMFSHVEIDDDVDLALYSKMQDEFAKRWDNGELPHIDTNANALRFRKTGRHKAIGVYCNALHAIAVDPRSPRSLLHEFAHAYDFENGQLSCTAGFKGIYRAYCDNLDTRSMSESKVHYYRTPTEVFARAWEVYAALHGIGGSFVSTLDEYGKDVAYAPLLVDGMAAMLEAYFSNIAKKAC